MPNAETVAYLVQFYEVSEIEAFWKQAGDALMSRSTTLIHITNSSVEGGSASGIALNTPDEQREFMAACRAAIAQLNEDTEVDPATLGSSVNFSHRPVTV